MQFEVFLVQGQDNVAVNDNSVSIPPPNINYHG